MGQLGDVPLASPLRHIFPLTLASRVFVRAYYNEVDEYAASWLRSLSDAGHIAGGRVDGRSILDVSASDLDGFDQCHFFAGIGVWSHALRLAGVPDDFPVWTGSCPCQPFSAAGLGAGFDDPRHLWPVWFKLIQQCRPPVIFGEQVASPDGLKWLDLVSSDLEGAGYSFGAADLCAAGVGAPHIRQRLYFVASLVGDAGCEGSGRYAGTVPRSEGEGSGERGAARGVPDESVTPSATNGFWHPAEWVQCSDGKARPVEPGSFPLAHGAPARVGRLRAYGNAIVGPLAATFIQASFEALGV